MLWSKTKAPPSQIPDHITRRVQSLSLPDLVMWSDQAIMTSGRYLTLWQRTQDPENLAEAVIGAQVLLAIVDEITRRTDA